MWQRLGGARADLGRFRPLAAKTFDDFLIEGPPMTDEAGVFQQPAERWALSIGGETREFADIDADSLLRAYEGSGNADDGADGAQSP